MTLIKASFKECECGGKWFHKEHQYSSDNDSWDMKRRDKFICLDCGKQQFSEWIKFECATGFSI